MSTLESFRDGPASQRFRPLSLPSGRVATRLDFPGMSAYLRDVRLTTFAGECVYWGVPFDVGPVVAAASEDVVLEFDPFLAKTLCFLHAVDDDSDPAEVGLSSILERQGHLGQHTADYVVGYDDGTELTIPIIRRNEIGCIKYEACVASMPHRKSVPVLSNREEPSRSYGWHEMRAPKHRIDPWMNYLFGWVNPEPEKAIAAIRIMPHSGVVLLSGITAGEVASNPFRWRERRKCILTFPGDHPFDPTLDEHGLVADIQLDLGQVISVRPRAEYSNDDWPNSPAFQVPDLSDVEYIVEYTSHEDAAFTLADGRQVPVAETEGQGDVQTGAGAHIVPAAGAKSAHAAAGPQLIVVPPAHRRVKLRVVDAESLRPIAAKLHIHGTAGEYLPPVHRHRIPNPGFFEDYGADHAHGGKHLGAYVDGTFEVRLPEGPVYVEASKGFEYRPARLELAVSRTKAVVEVPLEREINWRKRGWVTADTHVHFLSPSTALYEGEAEGVNVVNLLASQWGEVMTNVSDFDGQTTLRSAGWAHGEAPADAGEYLVRVGTENRQHILGHISLLGYSGEMITPLCSGGPDESAHGDPVEVLISEWAMRCRKQNGIVVMPHIPIFALESSAAMVEGLIDAVEMVSWGNMYGGLNPYSLTHWYQFLNCGYLVPAVGGTDKMSQDTAVGTVRTYARVDPERVLTYELWKQAIRDGDTFVTYGPLIDMEVDGRRPGSTVTMSPAGGTVTVRWEAASTAVQMTSVELVVNGRTVETAIVSASSCTGEWTVEVHESSWIACLVRGGHPGKPEVVAAHTSAVRFEVGGRRIHHHDDALAILARIQGSLAFLETSGTRADPSVYRRMRLLLEGSARRVHNLAHQEGTYHEHGPSEPPA